MSYAVSAALQSAIYQHLQADSALHARVGGHVFDMLPSGPLPPLYVALGPERVRDASDATANGARHDVVVSVVTDAPGFLAAKQAAAAVSDALHGADLSLDRGCLVALRFLRARAGREPGGRRRIDLTFRARVDDV